MTELQSIKQLNALKSKAINNGGYLKHKGIIVQACELHKEKFNKDFTPKNIVNN